MSNPLHIVGICGSLRKESYNRMLLNHARQYLPDGTKYTEADLTSVPFYNQDMEPDVPDSVIHLSRLIQSADGVIMTVPEYNFSFPGVLKNAIEWLSRPAAGRVFAGKSIALMGASTGNFGPARGHMQLRQVFFALEARPVMRPEVNVSNAATKFNSQGQLIDDIATDFVQKHMANFLTSITNH